MISFTDWSELNSENYTEIRQKINLIYRLSRLICARRSGGWYAAGMDEAPARFDKIALVGFMGTGKTVVGQALAHELRFEFVDTDHMIEKACGQDIPSIFENYGEEAFREMEVKILQGLEFRHNLVISTGGGLVTHHDNMSTLKTMAMVVCLWATENTIWNRVKNQKHRPLLNRPDAYDFICSKLGERRAFYRQAHLLINTENRSIRSITQIIRQNFADYRSGTVASPRH